MERKPRWRPEFKLEPAERAELSKALEQAYDEPQVRDLARELDVSAHGGNVPLREQIGFLLDTLKRNSLERRLVRIVARHPHHKLQAFAREVLLRQLSDDGARTLGDILKRLPQHWKLLHVLFLNQVSHYDDASIRLVEWTDPPGSDFVFHARCLELVEILNELPGDDSSGLKFPLLQFVRDALCTPVGSQELQLREWLRDAATTLGVEIQDLIVVDFTGDTKRGAKLAEVLRQRLTKARVMPFAPEPGQSAGEWLLQLPAIRVGLYVDSGERVNEIRPSLPRAPSYSVLFLVTPERVQLRDTDLPEALRGVPRVQWITDEAALNELYALVMGKPHRTAPQRSPRAQSGSLSREASTIAHALTTSTLTLLFGPAEHDTGKVTPKPAPTSGFRLGHELVSTLQPSLAALHPLVSIDFAGYVWTVKDHEAVLHRLITSLLRLRPGSIPEPHLQVAKLFDKLLRTYPSAKPLIVTTNLDVMLERALLENGVPFVRFVQKSNGIVSNRYDLERYGDQWQLRGSQDALLSTDPEGRSQEDYNRLQALIHGYGSDQGGPARQPWAQGDPRLVLYKYHGSADVEHDCECVVSPLDYELRGGGQVPGEIRTAINNRSQLFVGYTILDPQLRHVRMSLLREAKPKVAYAIHTALPTDCSDESTPCFGREVWSEMSDTWFREYDVRKLSEEASAFLASVEAAL